MHEKMAQWHGSRANSCITTEWERISVETVHWFLSSEAYWSKGIPQETVEQSLDNSLCVSLQHCGDQIGCAHVLSDCATFA